MADDGGALPRWPIADVYSGCMIGNHAGAFVLDVAVKRGLSALDDATWATLYGAMLETATNASAGRLARPCLESYEALGFCPQARAAALEKEIFVVRSVAATVERRAGPSRRRVRADALVRLRRLRGGRARALVGRRGGGGGREPLEALRKRLERRDAAVLSARRRRALALRGRSVGEHVAR